jgi:hypothetical protein
VTELLLFLLGVAVTAAVLGAFAFLIRAEIGDGRIARAEAAGLDHELDETLSEARAAAVDGAVEPAPRRR